MFYLSNFPTLGDIVAGPVTKLKNLSDVHSILLGAKENDVQLFVQKESYETFRRKNHLFGKLIFENLPKCASFVSTP